MMVGEEDSISKLPEEIGPRNSSQMSPVVISTFDQNETNKHRKKYVPVRVLIALLAIICNASCFFARQNLNFAIIAMVQDSEDSDLDLVDETIITYGEKFAWSTTDQMAVLGAFHWTYTFCQVPGARVTEIFGSTYILLTATIGSSLLSALSPLAAGAGLHVFFAVRLIMGICQAAIFPSCYSLLTQWLPLKERLLVFPVLNLSSYLGSIIAIEVANYFSRNPNFGWQYAFYAPACILAIWSIVWILVGSSHPKDNKLISSAELEYIEKKRGDINTNSDNTHIDWIKLCRSYQVWAIVISFFTSNWSFSLLLQLLPTYFKNVLKISPENNTFINVWVCGAYCIATPLVGILADFLIRIRPSWMRTIHIRKILESIGLFSQVIGFLLFIHAGRDAFKVQIILYIQIVLYSFVNGGEVPLPTEVSASFGGTIYGIANSVGASSGFIVPSLCGLMVTDETDINQWSNFLYFSVAVASVGGLLFLILGGNEPENFSKQSFHRTQTGINIIEITHMDTCYPFRSNNSKDTLKHQVSIESNGNERV